MLWTSESNYILLSLIALHTFCAIMKIAVIFLLVSISSFIETSNGLVPNLKPLDKDKARHYVRCVESTIEKVEILKKSPAEERKTREKCLVEDILHTLNMLAMDLQCTLEDVLELLELPLNVLELIKLGDLTALLNVIQLDKILFCFTRVLEAVLAQVNILLKEQLVILTTTLGSTVNILLLPLHDTLEAITTSLVGTLLGSVTGLVALPVKIVGSLLGGLGSLG